MKRRAAIAVSIALGLGGCGSSSLSASQMRSGATRICAQAQRRTEQIPTPTAPGGESSYLRQGVEALTPELTALRNLQPSGDMAGRYRTAVDATAAELGALRSTVQNLKAGDDPVAAIKTLQQKLHRPEGRARSAWLSLDVPSCLDS